MKIARCAVVFLVFLTGILRADKKALTPSDLALPDHPAPAATIPPAMIPPDSSIANPAFNPVDDDPGAVPKAFQKPDPSKLTPQEIMSLKMEQKKVDDDRDWLVRGYEQQLQAREHAEGDPVDDTNLYAELSGDKDLAKVAGISATDYTRSVAFVDLHTGESSSKSSALRPDPTLNAASPTAPAQAPFFKPLFPAPGSDGTASVASPFAAPSPFTLPFAEPLSLGSRPTSDESDTTDVLSTSDKPGDMDIPGMTAAESSPTTKQSMDLSNDDLLPGEVAPPERPHHDLSLELPSVELPAGSNADRLQKLQDNALSFPGQAPRKPIAPGAPVIAAPEPPSDTQEMVHDPTGIRNHVGDPFDILH